MIKEVKYDDLKTFDIEKNDNVFCNYIAYFDDDILGYTEYNVIYDRIEIVNIFVKEEHRNKKIGTSMLKYLIDNSSDKKNITLEVRVDNDMAIKLYESLGFKRVALRKGYYEGIDGYLMELVL